jgi:hypothetical protein
VQCDGRGRRGRLRTYKGVIERDGTHVPNELRGRPAGRYVLWSVDDDDEISPDEEAAVLAGLDDLDAGRVVPLEQVMEELRERTGR